MKGYPVTRDELLGLGGLSLGTTASFSIGGTFLARSWDIKKDLELSSGLDAVMKAKWQAKGDDYFTFALILFAFGVAMIIGGGLKVFSIIKSTKHPHA